MINNSAERSQNYYYELITSPRFIKALDLFQKKWDLDLKETFHELQKRVNIFTVKDEFRKCMVDFGIDGETSDWILFQHLLHKVSLRKIKNLNLLFKITDEIGYFEINRDGGGVIRNEDDHALPIAIKISPNASKRDLLNFIESEFRTSILPLQKFYLNEDIKLGKIRKKDDLIQKRNEFIYSHRGEKRKIIQSLLRNEFKPKLAEKQIPDIGNIGKIISLMAKERN